MVDIPIPGATDRTAIVGRTGSGKTFAAVWLLGLQDLTVRPWLIIDYKHDVLIRRLRAIPVDLDWTPKTGKPGLYIVHPRPDEDDEVEKLLWRVWEKGNCGLYIDEGHLLPDQEAFKTLLVQGRARRNPIITLSQRPTMVSRFVFSEATYMAVFPLNDRRDQITVENFSPLNLRFDLPKHHFWWFSVSENRYMVLKPVPKESILLQRVNRQLPVRRRWLIFGS
jgi:hypothetical protein